MRKNKTSSDSQDPDGRKQGGAALIIVVLTTLVVSALLGAMLIESNTEHLIAGNERDAERALEVSKAGLNYAYYLYENNLINPTTGGTAFNSFTAPVPASLDGGSFTGSFFDDSALVGSGQRYRIRSTGVFGTASRTVEMSFLLNSDALSFGFMGFNEVTLHRHNTKGATTFNISSTIGSNNIVSVDPGLNVDGSIVSSGSAEVGSTSTVQGDVFSYSINNSGTIKGRAGLVTSVAPTSGTPNVTDNEGTKYLWYSGRSNPGATTKVGGTVVGGVSRYVVTNGDVFDSKIFDPAGNLILNPPLNVIDYIAPPRLDYRAMKLEADLHDATYFTTPDDAIQYFANHKVTETIGGQTLTTIKIGTTTAPEFIYVVGTLDIQLNPAKADDYGGGILKADGLHIEGGIYASGGFEFNGKGFTDPAAYPIGYHQLYINALPYCFPGVIAYSQPTLPKGGTIATWVPANTPAIGSGAAFSMSSGSGDYEGTTVINGLVYAQADIHIHHTRADKELVTLRGAELAWKIHNCDFFNFVYDPQVACTKFLGMQGGGTPGVLSFREIR